jgi:dihydroorotate dehydrogenase electron transfer subunit
MLYKTLPVYTLRRFNRDYCEVSVLDPELAKLCMPGMFFELKAGTESQETRLFKPVSVAGASDGLVSFLIKVIGPGTQALASLGPGDSLKLIGPLGKGFPLVTGKNVLLVSGGVGYPPLEYLRKALTEENRVHFIHGGACGRDVFPCDRSYTVDGSGGKKGLVTMDVPDLLEEWKIGVVYSCGPLPMLKALARMVAPLPHYASLEAYMACGVGVCHGCAIPVGEEYQRVCADGPVFDASLVRWEEL